MGPVAMANIRSVDHGSYQAEIIIGHYLVATFVPSPHDCVGSLR